MKHLMFLLLFTFSISLSAQNAYLDDLPTEVDEKGMIFKSDPSEGEGFRMYFLNKENPRPFYRVNTCFVVYEGSNLVKYLLIRPEVFMFHQKDKGTIEGYTQLESESKILSLW